MIVIVPIVISGLLLIAPYFSKKFRKTTHLKWLVSGITSGGCAVGIGLLFNPTGLAIAAICVLGILALIFLGIFVKRCTTSSKQKKEEKKQSLEEDESGFPSTKNPFEKTLEIDSEFGAPQRSVQPHDKLSDAPSNELEQRMKITANWMGIDKKESDQLHSAWNELHRAYEASPSSSLSAGATTEFFFTPSSKAAQSRCYIMDAQGCLVNVKPAGEFGSRMPENGSSEAYANIANALTGTSLYTADTLTNGAKYKVEALISSPRIHHKKK